MSIKGNMMRVLCVVMALILLISGAGTVSAAGPTVTTTLTDNAVQRGSKKTFDVWARNAAGDKIKSTVKLNGEKVEPTWDDSEKTSYTLIFTVEGKNTVTVSAASDGGRKKELTYRITYNKAAPGEKIGTATWSVEGFTVGIGYLIYPVSVPIFEGETAAEQLIRLIHSAGFTAYYGGTVKSSFDLAYIADGTASGAKYNNYHKSGTPSNPRRLDISPSIPSLLVPYLKDTMTFYDPNDYAKNWSGYLGEFVFTNGSGWMYSVNNIFPNVGFADSYLSDGDVVRVQYTLGYGADIGGFGAVGSEIPGVDNQPSSGYYSVANMDRLTESICMARKSGYISRSNVAAAYRTALGVVMTLNSAQSAVDFASAALDSAVRSPSADTTAPSIDKNTPTDKPKDNNTPNYNTERQHGDTPYVGYPTQEGVWGGWTDDGSYVVGDSDAYVPGAQAPIGENRSSDDVSKVPESADITDTEKVTDTETDDEDGSTAAEVSEFESDTPESDGGKPEVNDEIHSDGESSSATAVISIVVCVMLIAGAAAVMIIFCVRKKSVASKAETVGGAEDDGDIHSGECAKELLNGGCARDGGITESGDEPSGDGDTESAENFAQDENNKDD